MEKIIVKPEKVRGLGNIVAQKTSNDFEIDDISFISENIEQVNGVDTTVFIFNSKKSPTLTITSATPIYSDEFDVVGVLEDKNGVKIEGATISLVWDDGTSHTTTETTDQNGQVSFHLSAPTSIRSYSFRLAFEGNSMYFGATSELVSVNVGKETSILQIISPYNNETIENMRITVRGTLTSDDGEAISGRTVHIYCRDQYGVEDEGIDATTDSNGGFTANYYPNSPDGELTLFASFEGDQYYLPNSKHNTIIKSTYDGMSLSKTAGKDTLSYLDVSAQNNTEYCTVTAQLKKGNNNVNNAGEPIKFTVPGRSTTVLTDNNGQASYTYTSAGAGDIVITVVPGGKVSLMQTHNIEDCVKQNWGLGFVKSSSYAPTTSVSDTTLIFLNSSSYCGGYIFNNKIGVPYSVELEYVDTSGGNFTFGLAFVRDNYTGSNTNYLTTVYYGKTNNDYWGGLISGSSVRPVTGDKYRFEVYSDHIDSYKNDVLLKTYSASDNPLTTGRFAIVGTDTPRKQQWRNLKIKKI